MATPRWLMYPSVMGLNLRFGRPLVPSKVLTTSATSDASVLPAGTEPCRDEARALNRGLVVDLNTQVGRNPRRQNRCLGIGRIRWESEVQVFEVVVVKQVFDTHRHIHVA